MSIGNDDESRVTVKFLLFSSVGVAFSFIEILNGAVVIPSGNVTVYGPDP